MSMESSTDIITPGLAPTLFGLLLERVKRTPSALAYRQYDQAAEAWTAFTWQQVAEQVSRWQQALLSENLVAGDRVAIMQRNSVEWVFFDQAALSLGLVTVPLYVEDRPENVAYILKDSGTKLLFCGITSTWEQIRTCCQDNETLQRVVCLSGRATDDGVTVSLDDWLPSATQPLVCNRYTTEPDSLATIVYTSGTTGSPKGVMLSHGNILADAYAGLQMLDVYPSDSLLSFLPLSHGLERTIGYYLPIMAGCHVSFARSIQLLAEDLVTLKPTILVSVPRIYERVYARIQEQLHQKTPFARRLFRSTVSIGWSRFEYAQGRHDWHWSFLLWPVLNKLVAEKILQKMGGRIRIAVCGGAALIPDVARLFIGLGLPLYQGYGLTEASPVVSVNTLESNRPESIGLPLQGIETRIDDNNELLVRGDTVMMGYWNNPSASGEIIDSDGWLHTGDKASQVDRHLYITGRLKEIIVMSNGEKVSPVDIENSISLDPLFEQVMVIGEAQPFLSAIVVLNQEALQSLLVVEGNGDDQAVDNDWLAGLLLNRIDQAMQRFPGYARIRKIIPVAEAFTIENGLITPTLKVKRHQVLQKYAEQVDNLYRNHSLT